MERSRAPRFTYPALAALVVISCARVAAPSPEKRRLSLPAEQPMPSGPGGIPAPIGLPDRAPSPESRRDFAKSVEAARVRSCKPHAKKEDARRACLAKCRHRNMHTDCGDEHGHMMPCPCHCD
jgi:hypothetical protein